MIGAISNTAIKQRTHDLSNNIVQNGKIKIIDRRKDARRKFSQPFPMVNCQAKDGYFKASITNLSSNGVFIRTHRPFFAGEEIAITFLFPISKNTKMVTGEIVRISGEGIGVVFKIFFSK